MSRIKSFIGLDFITMKPYLKVKSLLILGAVALYMTALNGNASSSIGMGLMIAVIFSGYPFALSEKSNMDALYTTLAIDRKGVVRGRYIFVFVLNICAILFSYILSSIGIFVLRMTNFIFPENDTFWAFIAMGCVFILIQAIQLPIYFKVGYAKAKVLSIIPFVLMMGAYSSYTIMAKDEGILNKIIEFSTYVANNKLMLISIVTIALTLIVFASYNLSLAFYKKREF